MKRITCAALAVSGLCVSARGQCVDVSQFIADDTVQNDEFGSGLAADGGLLLVGARTADFNGIRSGAVYVYDAATATQLRKFGPVNGQLLERFGQAIDLHGTIAIVGAPYWDGAEGSDGRAFLFDATTGVQLHELTHVTLDGYSELFGIAVAVNDQYALVGAPGRLLGDGAVFVYDVATGDLIREWQGPGAGAGLEQAFGSSVALSGNIAVIGAPRTKLASVDDAGAVYLYDLVTGNQLMILTASDAARADRFGRSVAIDSHRVLVGSSQDNNSGGADAGSAYVFDAVTGDQLHKLLATPGLAGAYLGTSVDLRGDVAIVGGHDVATPWDAPGSAYVFDVSSGEQISRLLAPDTALGDLFGNRVAIAADFMYVSAAWHGAVVEDEGTVYRFGQGMSNCDADLNNDCQLDFFDVQVYLASFAANDTIADLNNDGALDFFDVQAYLGLFSSGCP